MAKNKQEQTEKMTLEEYKEKYTKPENTRQIKLFLFIFAASIGVIIFTCLLIVVLKMFDINKYAGYVSIGVAVLAFIFLYIVPMVKFGKTKAFKTNVNSRTAREAIRYNRMVREEIADKMIDYTAKVEGANWYNDELVGKLAIARQSHHDKELKSILTEIYESSVNKTADRIIREHAMKVGLVTAISQSDKIDAMFIAVYELNLIKDIVYLYGFRPSDAKLVKIYRNVIINSLMAYGVSAGSTGAVSALFKGLKVGINDIPVLGAIISTAIGSTAQGIVNGVMTGVIGVQTKRYLIKEYRLQDILDEVVLDNPEEDNKMMESLSDDLKSAVKDKEKKG